MRSPGSEYPCRPARAAWGRRGVVARAADQGGVAVGGQRHAHAETGPGLPVSSLAVSFGPCWVQVEPERVNTHAAPTPLLSSGPPIRAVLPSADSATLSPNDAGPGLVAGGELWALLGPGRARAREHPRRPDARRCRCPAADQGRVAVSGQRHAVAELAGSGLVAGGELWALLGPGRARAREHPRRPDPRCRSGRRSGPCCRRRTAPRSSRPVEPSKM